MLCLSLTLKKSVSESGSVVSNSLWPHGLDSPWNSPSQNTGVGKPFLQDIFPTQELNPGLQPFPFSRVSSQPKDRIQVSGISGRHFTSWATREADEYWSGWPIPSPAGLPDPGIEPGCLALHADSLPAEPPGKPFLLCWYHLISTAILWGK